ncbi:MAG: hypothetical protein JJU29_01140 [Verrucomicrobia bacterium]|nr:hypothetical protein [Verrucomicrobiota bacterium]MCH8510488.1 hypothetical protein [Kiritimatiellia bacterium]
MSAESQYHDALSRWPGAGSGVHSHLMRIANLAALANVPPNEAEAAIIATMPRAPSPSSEITDALRKAYAEAGCGDPTMATLTPEQKRRLRERREAEREAQEKQGRKMAVEAVRKLAGGKMSLSELAALSPVDVGEATDAARQRRNAGLMLETLHGPDALVYAGNAGGGRESMAAVEDWQRRFDDFQPPPLHVVNPFTGKPGPKKSGGESYRADSCIARHAYALYECDIPEIDIETQAAFIASRIRAGWPIVSVVWSASKSLHALLRVDCRDAAQWQADVRESLFPVLEELGADRTCSNPSRLSRMPGHFRADKGNLQSLVYLNPEHGHRATATTATDTPPAPESITAFIEAHRFTLLPVQCFDMALSVRLTVTTATAAQVRNRLQAQGRVKIFTDPDRAERVAIAGNATKTTFSATAARCDGPKEPSPRGTRRIRK